jgi:hypothetical protein
MERRPVKVAAVALANKLGIATRFVTVKPPSGRIATPLSGCAASASIAASISEGERTAARTTSTGHRGSA